MEQRNSKFYEKYLGTPNVITPWYRNIVPVQVIIFFICFRHYYFSCTNLYNSLIIFNKLNPIFAINHNF